VSLSPSQQAQKDAKETVKRLMRPIIILQHLLRNCSLPQSCQGAAGVDNRSVKEVPQGGVPQLLGCAVQGHTQILAPVLGEGQQGIF
jgi:hypothetical protein